MDKSYAVVSRAVWARRVERKVGIIRARRRAWKTHIVGLVTMCAGYLACCGSMPTIEQARTMAAQLLKGGGV